MSPLRPYGRSDGGPCFCVQLEPIPLPRLWAFPKMALHQPHTFPQASEQHSLVMSGHLQRLLPCILQVPPPQRHPSPGDGDCVRAPCKKGVGVLVDTQSHQQCALDPKRACGIMCCMRGDVDCASLSAMCWNSLSCKGPLEILQYNLLLCTCPAVVLEQVVQGLGFFMTTFKYGNYHVCEKR